MSFRVYCANCMGRINPPFWAQWGRPFCDPECSVEFREKYEEAERERKKNSGVRGFFRRLLKLR